MRSLAMLATALVTLSFSMAGYAETVTYDLTLNAPSPYHVLGSGTGSFSVLLSPDQSANDAMGYSTPYSFGNGLLSFTATIAGETYTETGGADVYLEDGQVAQLLFLSEDFALNQTDDLILDDGTFTLLRDVPVEGGTELETEEGSITATQVTPEPASLVLVATGLFGAVALAQRRLNRRT